MTALFTILSVIIGLVFVLLLFSLLTSTVMEIVAAVLSLRGKHLLGTLKNMLGARADDFLDHPFFKQLSYADHRRKKSDYALPNWVSKETFSAILLDLPDGKDAPDDKKTDLEEVLAYLRRQSNGTAEDYKTRVEHWFDEVMERATERYKRAMKWWLFGVGFLLAIAFNADTVQIYKSLSNNAALREDFVRLAEGFQSKAAQDSAQVAAAEKRLETLLPQFKEMALTYQETVQSPLGLGWTEEKINNWQSGFWVRLAGWILTGIAVTFGAPFWFEALRKLIALRNAKAG